MKPSPITCDCCGKTERHAEVKPVAVENRHNGEHADLALCAGCRSNHSAAWLLRWRPVDSGQVAA